MSPSPPTLDVYLYGTVVASTIHRIAGPFPALDTYGELSGTWHVPGGEAMNAALVLGRLGLKTRVGGPRLGRESGPLIRAYAQRHGIELGLQDEPGDWPGVLDMILVDDDHRTVFGSFGRYFGDPVRRWDPAEEAACRAAKVVCIDPWFPETSEAAARLCAEVGTPYVAIDCAPESFLATHAAALVISGEFRRGQPRDDEALFEAYRAATPGLVVFSSGSGTIRFGRRGGPIQTRQAFQVQAVSTLGAGDVFRAGIAWGLYQGSDDVDTVRFAAGLAALCCTRMPIADTAPTLAEVQAFLERD